MKTPETQVVGALRLEWRPLGDRTGHKLVWNSGGTDQTLLESIEGATDDARWPASPPLFDWHCEKRPGTTVLLGVGLAGKSHWSAAISVEQAAATTANGADCRADAGISFDIACRAGETPRFLGSSYRYLGRARQLTPCEVDFGKGCLLSADIATTRLVLEGDTLIIEPLSTAAEAWPQTFRWRYTLSILT